MISFEMEDLIGVLQGLTPYLIAMGIAIVAAIVVIIAVKKMPKPKKRMIRWEAVIAMLLVIYRPALRKAMERLESEAAAQAG